MAVPPVKDDEQWESTSESSEEEDEEDEEMQGNIGTEIVNIDFEARTPEESDFTSIQRLLKQLLPTEIDLSDMTNLILSQNYIGAVVFQPTDDEKNEESDEEEDIFGVTTMINLTTKADRKSIQDLLKFLKSKFDSGENFSQEGEKFSDFFSGKMKDVGWIINERFINLPSQIAPNLFESLRNDIEDAVKKFMPYKVSRYLLIAKAHVPKGGNVRNPVFVNDEEELFFQNSVASFSYKVEKNEDSSGATSEWKNKKDKELFAIRVVMLVEPSVLDREVAAFGALFKV